MKQVDDFIPLLRASLAYYHASETLLLIAAQERKAEFEGGTTPKQRVEFDRRVITELKKQEKARQKIADFMAKEKREEKPLTKIRRMIGKYIAGD